MGLKYLTYECFLVQPEELETPPEYLLLLPWNLKDEIMTNLAYAREWTVGS
ncbi:MAG: hypothetical protein ACREYE_16280 [Gammaproteobacteria bacterium]